MIFERSLYVGLASEPQMPVVPVGMLKLARRGVVESGEFAYGRRYLQLPEADALNPDFLPLQDASFVLPERRIRDGGALPLTFRDALPDSWGRKVLEAQHGKPLADVDVLLMTNADRVGAMVFSENLPLQADAPAIELIELETLAEAVRRLEFAMEITPAMQRLLQRGGSLGGARPKATFIHDDQRWIAKFPAHGDAYNVEIVEAATLALAQHCGIDVAPFFLHPLQHGHALLLRRFDRQGKIGRERRMHYLSASALLDVPYESSGGSYAEFAQMLRRISNNPAHDLAQLYRRMIFNLVVDNSDDHVKNHGVLHVGKGQYRLAPAFDLVAQLSNIGYQQLPILPGRFEAHLDLARAAAPQFGLSLLQADAIIGLISSAAQTDFSTLLATHGADHKLCERVRESVARQIRLIAS